MRLWIKYDSVSLGASETCQDCHLFSDSIAVKWQFKGGGVCLYLGRFSIFALFLHTAEHYFLSIVLQTVFHLWGFVVSSFSLCLSLSRRDFLSSPLFPLTLSFTVHHPVLYSSSDTGLGAHKEPTHPSPSGPPITCPTHHLALKAVLLLICFSPPSAAFLPFFSPFLPPSTKTPLLLLFLLFCLLPILLLTPQAWRSFLCSWHLFCSVINWDEHVGWRPVEGELRPPR